MISISVLAQNCYNHTALNYTSCLKINYITQQRTVRKFSEDDHYCSALYKYALKLAIKFRDFTSFISTGDKNKVKCGEPGCWIPAVTRGKRVLVARGTTVETADHNFHQSR